jgi:hypothetical protein
MGSQWGRSITVEGHPVAALKDAVSIFHVVTTPGYFRTLQIPLREGRDFTEADFDNPEVTIIAESWRASTGRMPARSESGYATVLRRTALPGKP